MKTLVAFAAVLLLCVSQVSAQDRNVGFYLGANSSGFDINSPNISAVKATGWQAGGYYRSGKFLYGQMGFEYAHLQTDLEVSDSTGTSVDHISMNRIQVPLYAGVNLLNFSKRVVNLRVYAGPVFSYLLNTSETNPDAGSDFNRFGANGTVAGGLDILIFSMDAGYSFGFTDLFKNDFSGKGNYAFINLGVKF